jgi:hypothetical protein
MDDVTATVRWILTEEAEGESGWWWGEDSGGYGGSGGATLYSTFIRPIVDVVDTAAATIETGLSKVQLLTNIATYGVMSMLVPWIKPQYDQMIDHDRRRMSEMYRRHADTFAHTEQAMTEVGGNFDGAGVFFALFPGAVIAKNVSRVASAGSERAAKTAVDTMLDFIDGVTLNALGSITDAVRSRMGLQEVTSHRGLIHEENDADDRRSNVDVSLIVKLMNAKKVQAALASSDALTDLRDDALDALHDTVDMAVEPVLKLSAADSLSDVERITGKRWRPEQITAKFKVDVNPRDVDKVIADLVPALTQKAARPFTARLTRLNSDIMKLMGVYNVSGNDPTARAALSLLETGIKRLNAA